MAPTILAIDTTQASGSVALACGDQIVAEVPLEAPDGFAHVIYAHLQRVMEQHELQLPSIDCFAATAGPGSFTGVRVGLACVKGLAEASGRPAVAVSNLEVLAHFGSATLRAPVLDARRGEVYGALYDSEGRLVSAEIVAPLGEWLKMLPAEVEFVTPEVSALQQQLTGTRYEGARVSAAPKALAAGVAKIALRRLVSGGGQDPAALDANYVRRSDAELFWKE
ncbi:MAG: tRNA (adenosine(37)-N6)-threonylcarbamoyltransferase complex dimerization subunit type 1 TsaB [Acidobacteriia bacterium]|nr:tRNA (adenosine(37)-N6)-threonylcarbamoyltransferase complex dimerization subunit type 1 TsaB [Terriglobia bacterium]